MEERQDMDLNFLMMMGFGLGILDIFVRRSPSFEIK